MELFLFISALVIFCFASALTLTALNYGLSLGDRMLSAFGSTLKWCLIMIGKGLNLLVRYVIKRMSKSESDLIIRPLFVSAVELQHLKNKRLIHSNKHMPVEIEYPQQKKGN